MAASCNLSVLDVAKVLQSVSVEDTRSLIFYLGVEVKDLDDISMQYNGDNKKVHFLQKWLSIDIRASWKRLVYGLQQIKMNVLAEEVQAMYVSRASGHNEGDASDVSLLPPSSAQTINLSSQDNDQCKELLFLKRVANVKESIEDLEDIFFELKSDTRASLCEKEHKDKTFLGKFRDFLLDLPVSKRPIHSKFFLHNEEEILEAKSIQKLFAILSRYCNYSNYEIILLIVKKFCEAQLKKRMLVYRDSIEHFEKVTTVDVYLCAISAQPNDLISEAFCQMAMKINKPTSVCTLHEIRQLKESIAQQAALHSYSMYIQSPEEGSVRVTLQLLQECADLVIWVMTPDFRTAYNLSDVTLDGEYVTVLLSRQQYTPDWRKHVETVASLISTSPECSVQDKSVQLRNASWRGDVDVVVSLIEAGANINDQDEDGYSALMRAAMEGNTGIVSLLIESGSNPDLQSKSQQYSALIWAATKGFTEVVALLLQAGANLDLQDKGGYSALMRATLWDRFEVVTLLLKAGASTDLQDKNGDSILILSAMEGRIIVVTKLLEAGALLNLQNNRGDTAVIVATVNHHPDILRQLVRAEADLNLQNEEGLSPLIISSRSGRTELTAIILSGNVHIDIEASNGWSALFYSADRGDLETTKLLLKAGANPHLLDHNELTPLDVAAARDQHEVCKLLISHMQTSAVPIQRQVTQALRELVKKASKRAKQAFINLEVRIFRTDKMIQQLQEVKSQSRDVDGDSKKKLSSTMTPEEEIGEEYRSRLTQN